ncbi:MAG: hypothetical protein M3422_09600 [Actinomycetota bacterium]|nr:hypothetical protein [Actinomycetota bacterium]
MTKLPVWVRIPGIVVLVLIGVIVSATIMGTAGSEGHGPGDGEIPRVTEPTGAHMPPAGGH